MNWSPFRPSHLLPRRRRRRPSLRVGCCGCHHHRQTRETNRTLRKMSWTQETVAHRLHDLRSGASTRTTTRKTIPLLLMIFASSCGTPRAAAWVDPPFRVGMVRVVRCTAETTPHPLHPHLPNHRQIIILPLGTSRPCATGFVNCARQPPCRGAKLSYS